MKQYLIIGESNYRCDHRLFNKPWYYLHVPLISMNFRTMASARTSLCIMCLTKSSTVIKSLQNKMNTIIELNNVLGWVPDIHSVLRIGDDRVKPRTIKCIFHGQLERFVDLSSPWKGETIEYRYWLLFREAHTKQ